MLNSILKKNTPNIIKNVPKEGLFFYQIPIPIKPSKLQKTAPKGQKLAKSGHTAWYRKYLDAHVFDLT